MSWIYLNCFFVDIVLSPLKDNWVFGLRNFKIANFKLKEKKLMRKKKLWLSFYFLLSFKFEWNFFKKINLKLFVYF